MRIGLTFGKEHRVAILTALGGLLVTLIATLSERLFEPGYGAWPLIMVSLAPIVVGIGLSRLNWVVRLAVQGVVAVGGVVVVLSRHEANLPGDLLGSVRRGASAVFGTRWPVPSYARAVGFIAILTVVAAVAAVELAISGRFTTAVLLPSTVLLATMSLATAEAGPPPPRLLVLFTLGGLAVLRLASLTNSDLPHHAKGSPETVERRSVLTMAIVGMTAVSVGVVPALLSGATSNDDRWDPRRQIQDDELIEDEISPLSRLDVWQTQDPPAEMFRTSHPDVGRWRVATMTRFDGRSWMPPADYQLAGTRIAEADERADEPETIDVVWGNLDVRWLPTIDRTLSIDRRVKVDAQAGGFLVARVPAPQENYQLVVQSQELLVEVLKGAPASVATPSLVEGVELPPSIIALANSIAENEETDYGRATALADFLRSGYQIDRGSPGGHTVAQLSLFLETTKSGRDEQFVAAYGLLASSIGLPVRLAVGFRTTEAPDGGTVAMSDQAESWPEVEFRGIGWVPIEVVPEEREESTGSGERPVNQAPLEEERSPPTTQAAPPTTVQTEAPASLASGATGAVPNGALKAGIGFGALLVALAGYVIVVLRLKTGRRRRRQAAADPEVRATGAFRSSIDTLIDLGGRAPAVKTDQELAAGGAGVLRRGSESLTGLATLSTRAVYDAPEPDETMGDEAWRNQTGFEADARASVTRWRWWRSRLSLRSLRRGLPGD